MLKVLRTADVDVVFTLIGRLKAETMADLIGLLATEPPGPAVVLDLTDLVLVDRDAVRFLRGANRTASCFAISLHTFGCGWRGRASSDGLGLSG